ncbi:type II toxin-antitoxin system HicA family toxin [bacterium]|nr:type II toxin-antitoxin system HicA family toxin [bacterium]
MGLHTRLRNKKFYDVIHYIEKNGLVVYRRRGDHHTIQNPKNKRTYPINPIGKKEKNAIPDQLKAMMITLELSDDFWNDL